MRSAVALTTTGSQGIHSCGTGEGHRLDIAQLLGHDGDGHNGKQLVHDVGQESGGRYGEGVRSQQGGGQGIPAESGRCRYAVLGAQGQEQPYQGRHRKGARHNRQRDQKDPEPGGPNIPDQATLPAHIQAHQKEEQVQPPADDRATVGYGGVGEQEAARQNARRYGEDDGEGQAVVHVDRLPGTRVAVLRCLLAGTALSVQLQQIFSQGVDSQHAAHHGGEGDRQGVEPNGAQGRDDLLVGPSSAPRVTISSSRAAV